MKKLALFGTGSGSNAENIYNYFKASSDVSVVLICTNKKDSFIVKRAKKLNLPIVYTNKTTLSNFIGLHQILKNYEVDYIIPRGVYEAELDKVESSIGTITNKGEKR